MKKSRCLAAAFAVALLLLVPTIGMAADQVSHEKMNEVSIDLSVPIGANIALVATPPGGYAIPLILGYHRVLTSHLAVFVSPGILVVVAPGQPEVIFADLWLELDWHPFREGLGGFFVGPAVNLVYIQSPYYPSETLFLFGGSLGYQFLLGENFSLDLSLGLTFGAAPSSGPQPVIPRGLIALGYRF